MDTRLLQTMGLWIELMDEVEWLNRQMAEWTIG